MKDFKIKGTVSELKSIAVCLLSLGYKWGAINSEKLSDRAKFLYIGSDTIDVGVIADVFSSDYLPEMTIEEFWIIVSKLNGGEKHFFVNNWSFKPNEIEEANLANTIAIVAEKNGLSINDMAHIYPLILRMLKSKIQWAE
jgi:hypothetical protein